MTPALLVVDDDVDACRNLQDILTDLGYQVDTASNGQAALDLVEKRIYDVALLDLKMPGMDGVSLYREIKKRQPATVPMIVSAYASSTAAAEALAAGVSHVLAKPVDFEKLFALIQGALDLPVILIVDDDRDLCQNLWELLVEKGYRVNLAHDEQEAAKRLRDQDLQAVLIDVRLPRGGNAQRIFQEVRALRPKARTILITGHRGESEELVQQVLHEGADAVCNKPFDVPGLLGTLDRLCRAAQDKVRP